MDEQVIRGFKFLTPYNTTIYNDIETVYPVPGPDEKWGPWYRHPEPGEPDDKDCGPGGWHMMNRLDARYAPSRWHPWFAEGRLLLGQSKEKSRVVEIRLRRINNKTFCKILRFGYCEGANLRCAYLSDANLRCANLIGADLRGADLRGAVTNKYTFMSSKQEKLFENANQ